jgi:hypothetical protein
MAITVKHKFVSAIPDSGDTTIVQPSNWNDTHDLVGTVPVANGGTGAATLTGYVKGNGTAAMTAASTIPNTDITGLGTASTKDAGVANGVATLDSSGQVPLSQIPPLGDLNYQGAWNANTNSPTLTSSVGTKGFYYVVSVAGTTNLNGITDWQIGDWAVFNGSVWQKIDNTDSVTSVNGKTGVVVLTNTDISGFGTMSTQNANSVAITGGTINGTSLGLTTPSTAAFTTLSANAVTSTTPVLSFNASNAIASFGSTTSGSYNQLVIQNKSGTAGASTNYVISNDLGTDSTYYGEFGMNASVYSSGTPSDFFSLNNGVYFSAHDGDVSIGSGNGYKTYFVWGTTGNHAHVINASGAIGLDTSITGATNFGTVGQVLTSGGSGATPTWQTPTTGTVTSVTGTSPVTSTGGNTPAIGLASGYGDTQNPYASKTANYVLAAPNGSSGVPTFRAIVAADIPTLNQNTTGSAAKWTTARTESLTGDITGSTTVDGSANYSIATTLATVNSNVGSFTNASVTVNGKGLITAVSSGTAPVTSVAATSPVVSSGGTTPTISMPAATTSVSGYLTSTDWNTFNNKGSGTVTSVTGTAPVVSSGGTTPVISMAAATGSVNGYLTSTDWTTFNGKAPAVTYTTNYVPFGQGTTTPNLSSSFTYVTGTGTLTAPAVNASNGLVVNSNTVAASYSIPSGSSAMSTGPMTVASGQSVTIPSGSRWVVL